MKTLISLAACVGIVAFGCSTQPAAPSAEVKLPDFLADGKTTKKEVLAQLGEPSGRFESERILTYRLSYKHGFNRYGCVPREATPHGTT